MRLNEIKTSPDEIVRQQFAMFKGDVEETTGVFGWETELVQRTSDSVVVKAYWEDESGSMAVPIIVIKKLAYKHFIDSDIDINYGIGMIDEQEHHSLYQLVLGW